MSLLGMMYCVGVMAQNIDVSGTVVDEQDQPVIGASVLQKGSSNGTVTDIDGNFSFKAPQGVTLVVSYIDTRQLRLKLVLDSKLNYKPMPVNLMKSL